MEDTLREAATSYPREAEGIPWPWSVPDGEWTWESFSALPDDGNRYEVIGGRLEVSPSPKIRHQRVSLELVLQLGNWAKRMGSGEVLAAPLAVVLPNAGSYLEPDLLFIAQNRLSIVTSDNVQGPPDLVVEILSPGSARADWVDKKAAYQAAGVSCYWVVDPEGRILTAFRLVEGVYKLEGRWEGEASWEPEGFPGLMVHLAAVWE